LRARRFRQSRRSRPAPESRTRLKISSAIVGTTAGPTEHDIDARWLMAYNAALGESDPRSYDTAAPGGVPAHPLFPVCYEWPVSGPIRRIPALREFFPRLVHAEHDLLLHRPVRQGDRLKTVVQIASVAQRKPGAFVVFRFETTDAAGSPVSTTDFGVLYRDVAVDGPDRGTAMKIPPVEQALTQLGTIEIAGNAAHVYTECARIWNPIHTDIAHARAAGLPGIILHGTATLALSISRALAGTDPRRVRRVQCRFSGMVLMPSVLGVFGHRDQNTLCFETRKSDGEAVVSRGRIELDG
jgi:acyl dehydratase